MPVDMSRYPPDWKAISLRIRDRAGWVCEECGAPNGAVIVRDPENKARWRFANDGDLVEGFERNHSTVVLTVHHVGAPKDDGSPGDRHDKMDCRDVNLKALCQRCHFMADLDLHIIHARESRLRKKAERLKTTGQQALDFD